MFEANVYRIFIASPSDVEDERNAAEEVILDWNSTHSERRQCVLMPVRYERDAYPITGMSGQTAINQQCLEKCNFLIGIFGNKIGTPTKEFPSGTIEEITKHCDAGKPAMLYFSRRKVPLAENPREINQQKKLVKFKNSIEVNDNSFYGEFSSTKVFKYKLKQDLDKFINDYVQKQAPFSSVSAGDKKQETTAKNSVSLSPKKTADLPKVFFNSQKQILVLIPAGKFMMGDTRTPEDVDKKYPGGNVDWYKDAHPRHSVKISQPFYMSIYEVTVADFRRFVEAEGYETTAEEEGTAWGYNKEENKWDKIDDLNWRHPGIEQNSRHPVTCVSWNDARKYIEWLNKQDDPNRPAGYQYALPTEAQWEYACRAGRTTDFFWGNSISEGKKYLNGATEDGTPWGTKWDYCFPFKNGYTGTSPVGSFEPNKWGLYDMLGNVWEWCSDYYDSKYYENSPETDPTGPDSGSLRVNRGGGWDSDAGVCRSANRSWGGPASRSYSLGFRVALVPSK